jgi:hypothetical protein
MYLVPGHTNGYVEELSHNDVCVASITLGYADILGCESEVARLTLASSSIAVGIRERNTCAMSLSSKALLCLEPHRIKRTM